MSDSWEFGPIPVINESDEQLSVTGSFNCKVKSLVFSFIAPGVGCVCRYCINGIAHYNDFGKGKSKESV